MKPVRKSTCVIDHEDDIDWHTVINTLEADLGSETCGFISAAYDSHEDALKAMDAAIDRIFQEAMNRVRSNSLLVAGS